MLKMRVVLYFGLFFLQCLVGINADPDFSCIPDVVWTGPQQCQERGFPAMCKPSPVLNAIHKTMCIQLPCAFRTAHGYVAVWIGRPATGTPCGTERVCHEGQCIKIPWNKFIEIRGSPRMVECRVTQ